MKHKFPKLIYVTRDPNASKSNRRDDEDLIAWPTKDASGENGDSVGEYELVGTLTLKVTRELV